ncbi:MAG: hypothetical protein Q7T03_02085 [Deltaproteobacteria bacterium]|nr:hypothetical protein [Deltaproteobacteria bacterium]
MKKKKQWPEKSLPQFSPEQTLVWLDEQRQFLFEVWKKNPKLRKRWETLNQPHRAFKAGSN